MLVHGTAVCIITKYQRIFEIGAILAFCKKIWTFSILEIQTTLSKNNCFTKLNTKILYQMHYNNVTLLDGQKKIFNSGNRMFMLINQQRKKCKKIPENSNYN